MNGLVRMIGIIGLMLLGGCATLQRATDASPPGVSKIETLYETAQCEAISRGGFILIDDAVVLQDLLLPLGESTANRTVESVNFNNRQVLVVDFGASPSGGFADGLASDVVQVTGTTAVVRLNIPKRVKAEKRQTQNMTHRCTLYMIPKGYAALQVRSQFDDLLIEY